MTSPGNGVQVGEGFVEVDFDVDQGRLNSLNRVMSASGRRFGVSLGTGIERATNDHLFRIGRNLEQEFSRHGARAGRSFTTSIRQNIDHNSFRRLFRGMNDEVDRFTGNLSTSLRLLSFSGLFRPFNVLLLTLLALTPAAFALASSLAQASLAASAAIPAFFGLAGAVTALTLAFKGPLSAFKEYLNTQENVAQSSNALANRQAALRNAEEALARARVTGARQVADAQRALTEARVEAAQEIRNLRAEARDAALDEEGASIRLARAREELRRIQKDSTASTLDRREAVFAVRVAENDLTNAIDRNKEAQKASNEAQKKGVEGSKQVQDANRRLKEAQDDANRSIKEASAAVTEAARKYEVGTSAQEKFSQQMAELSPAGRQFVQQLILMNGGLDNLSRRLQTAALPGFTSALKDISGLAPMVSRFLINLAGMFGDAAREAGALTKTPLFRQELKTILQGNETATRSLLSAVNPLIAAVMTIGAEATPILVRFAHWLAEIIKRFSAFIEAKRQSGELAKTLRQAADEAAKWGKIIGNFTQGIINLFLGALEPGQKLSDKLLEISERFKTWTETNTEKIREFFDKIAGLDYAKIVSVALAITGLVSGLRALALVGAGLEAVAALFSPAGLFVIGVLVLAAGFFLLYTRVNEFKNAIDPWLRRTKELFERETIPAFKDLWDSIVDLGRALKDLGIDWELVGRIVGALILGQLATLTLAVQVLTQTLRISSAVIQVFGEWWKWLWDHILVPIGRWISNTLAPSISKAIDQAKTAFLGFRNTVREVMGAVELFIWDKLRKAQAIADSFKNNFIRIFVAIAGGVRVALNGVIGILNQAIALVNKILPGNLRIHPISLIGAVQIQIPGGANPATFFRGLATGGRVFGPGTATSDSIPAYLSNGEHVWTAKEVQKAGGHAAVEDMRRAALAGFKVPGYAFGGAIDAIIALGRKFGAGPPTSTFRPGDPLNHGKKLAVDFGGFNQDAAASRFMAIGRYLMELIHVTNRGNYGIYHGRRYTVTGALAAQHRNHIHVAASPQAALAALGGNLSALLSSIGGLFGDLFDPVAHLKTLLTPVRKPFDTAINKLREWGFAGQVGAGVLKGALDGLIQKVAPSIDLGFAGPGPGGGVERWRGLVSAVLTELGVNTAGNVNAVLTSIQQESGGNPSAVQGVRDINSVTGDLAKGLNQVIGATFRAYAGKYVGRGQFDPYANIYASVRYAMSRYGSRWASVMAAPGGYDSGGLLKPGQIGVNTSRKPEAVFTDNQFRNIIDNKNTDLENINISLVQHADYVEAVIASKGKSVRRKFKAGIRHGVSKI